MPGALSEVQIHPSRPVRLPGSEDPVSIDTGMIPLVLALWQHGLETSGSCQDLGEAIEANAHGSSVPAHDRQRHAAFRRGQAWLRMPTAHARTLLDILAEDQRFATRLVRWTHPEAWETTVRIFPQHARGDHQVAQLHFPAVQIPDVLNILG